jgi:tRNA-specific 2-thiouridylase
MRQVVAVAMSGGVDSSVAAAVAVEAGHEVFGLMLRLWSDPGAGPNRCCAPDDVARARQTAAALGIPFYVLDARDAFRGLVVEPFVYGYAQGITPNPCLNCNRGIRWGFLLDHALAMGATHLATGHYARNACVDGHWRLMRALDREKDQSYVLSVLDQRQLAHALFPIGSLRKLDVRMLAAERRLPAMRRHDSQDLCFLGGADYREFLSSHIPEAHQPGPILDLHGQTIGVHSGLVDYTVGQRKGLRISASEPLYVLEKRPETNTRIVGPRAQLGRAEFTVSELTWVDRQPTPRDEDLTVQIRYRSRELPATIQWLEPGRAHVRIPRGLAEITPGQAAVFYRGEECLGGGRIDR